MNLPDENAKKNGMSTLDRILSTEEELIPSSGFLASVMERVEDESRAPAPIRFPWKRAIPGFVLAAGVFGWGEVVLVREAVSAIHATAATPMHLPAGLSRRLCRWVGWDWRWLSRWFPGCCRGALPVNRGCCKCAGAKSTRSS